MAIFGSQGAYVTIAYLVAGQLCEVTLQYYNENPTGHHPSDVIADAFQTAVQDELRACMAAATTLVSYTVDGTAGGGGPDYPPYTLPVGLAGLVASQPLPSYVSIGVFKVPDNTNIEPALAQPFKNGMARFPAIPESFQDNSALVGDAFTAFAALNAVLEEFVASGDTYHMIMGRGENTLVGGNPAAVVPVTSLITAFKTGTQNTRKI